MQANHHGNIKKMASHFGQRIFVVAFGALLYVAASSGCIAQAPGAKTAATKADSSDSKVRAAQDTMEKLIHAYEAGEVITTEPYLHPAMVGTQVLLDNIRNTQTQQKKISIVMKDTQAVAGTDEVIISFQWEKRYLALPGTTPKLATGHASFMMKDSAAGWCLTGIAGDNIFAAYAR